MIEVQRQQWLLTSFMYLIQKNGEREARVLLDRLKLKVSDLFEGVEVLPSLLHGDLWSGNQDETEDSPGWLHNN